MLFRAKPPWKADICYVPPQCLSYTPILIPTAVLWLSTNFPPNVVCADLAMCEAAKALQALLLQVSCLQILERMLHPNPA